MKKAKKLLCALLAMLFVLSGCGLSANTNVPSNDDADGDTSGEVVEAPGRKMRRMRRSTPSSQQPPANPDKMVIKYASTSADLNGQAYLRAARKFLQTLKEELGDKIEIQYYMNSTFGGTADAVLGGLQNNTFELTDWPLGSLCGVHERISAPGCPLSRDQQ